MMNVLIFLLSFTSIPDNADKDYQLVGKREYKYDENGLRSHKISFDSENQLEKMVQYFYDEHGNKIKTEKYNATHELIAVYKYQFNGKNQKINSSKTDYLKNKETGKLYFYDDTGKNSKTEYYFKNALLKTVEYAFNEFGHQVEYSAYNAKGEQSSLFYTENKYDKTGKLLKKFKRGVAGKLVKLNHYIYNKESQIIESFSYYYTGKRGNSKRTYQYDTEGRKTGFFKYIAIETKH